MGATIKNRIGNASGAAYPLFNSALGSFPSFPSDLNVKYTDVVARIYPLPASLSQLTRFCDAYLNHFDDPASEREVVPLQFRPAASFVLMEVVNYGEMASNIANAGWFSQHELAFGLPLEVYEFREDRWTFAKWAMCYPFIYVDSALSMSGGRQVYGWSKEFFYVDAQAPIFEPTGPKLLLHASVEVPSERVGETDIVTFLKVSQEQLAYSAKSLIPDVISVIPRAITSSLEAAYELLNVSGLAHPSNEASSDSIFSMIRRFYGGAYSFLGLGSGHRAATPGAAQGKIPPVSLITFKQFRDAVDSRTACFQALVDSQMHIDRITDARLMSDLAAPDSSAGITIALLDHQAQPLVRMLGIQGQANGASDRPSMVRIKPVMPFWVQMDLSMGVASRQIWRTPWTAWTCNMDAPSMRDPRPIEYIGLGSGAGDELCAPFKIQTPYLKMRVLPLKADLEKLKSLVHGVFADQLEVTPIDRNDDDGVVCLILSGFTGLTTDGYEGGSYSDFELTLAIPIKWRKLDVADAPYTYGLFPAYTFVGEAWNATTSFEVYGRLTMQSSFISQPDLWNDEYLPPYLETSGFNLRVTTKLFSSSDSVPTAQDHDVVGIQFHKPQTAPATTPPTEGFLQTLGFIQNKESLSLSSIALKQVRDAVDPSRADLQTIVQLNRTFTPDRNYLPRSVVDWLPALRVTLGEYTTLPFVTKLGLTKYAASSLSLPNGDGTYTLVSETPFYLVGSMHGSSAVQFPESVGSNRFVASLAPAPTKLAAAGRPTDPSRF